jgi:hypothetical protein
LRIKFKHTIFLIANSSVSHFTGLGLTELYAVSQNG